MRTMGYSEAQTYGFVDSIEGLQKKERAVLVAGNLDVDEMQKKLAAAREKAIQSNQKQEQKKRELRESTEEHEADLKALYVIGSSQLDMMIGSVEKNSIVAKNFRRIRSRLKRPNAVDATEAQPIPTPTPRPVPKQD